MLAVGCADDTGGGGAGGGDICAEVRCDDGDDCTDNVCDPADPRICVFPDAPEDAPCDGDGVCDGAGKCVACNDDDHCEDDFNECATPACYEKTCLAAMVEDGTPCAGGMCQAGQCKLSGSVLPCTEQGIRNAIAAGGGPYTFDCEGPTKVTTGAEIAVHNDVVLDGSGNLTVDGNGDHRLFSVLEGVSVELDGFVVTGGSATREKDQQSCGGLANEGILTLANSTVSRNSAALGGGGGVCNSGLLTLINSALVDNTANACAGLFSNGWVSLTNSTVSGNSATLGGGGICSSGFLTLLGSTVSGNSADHTGGIESSGTLALTNSTVSGNASEEGGGGIFNVGTATLTNATLSENTVAGELDAVRNTRTLTVANSLINGRCNSDVGVIASNGHNIESPGDTCAFDRETDQVDVQGEDLKLEGLADNGGTTMTHALRPGSVAIDRIPAAMCELDQDQRGVPRPQGDACDVGAFELEP